MPNKTIYVSDGDLPLFERAQELAGGNLSAAIATALRRYVEAEEMRENGEIVVKVGAHGAYVQKRFQGRLVGKYVTPSADHSRVLTYRVYHTAKGNLAVSLKETPNWSRRNWGSWERAWENAMGEFLSQGLSKPPRPERPPSGWDSYEGDWWHPVFRLDVYSSLDELRGQIPDPLFAVVAAAVQHDGQAIEDLDI